MQNFNNIIDEIFNQNIESANANNFTPVIKYVGKYNLIKETYEIKKEHSALFQKPPGKYVVVNFENTLFRIKEELEYLINHLSKVIKDFLNLSYNSKVLIIGLGNRQIRADALGIATIKNVIVTSGLNELEIFKNKPTTYTFATSVMGLTGLESSEIVKALIEKFKPNKLIVIDTLCATNFKRLGGSFQINNGGIIPGGGVGNSQKAISKNSVNVEVISIGVPLVVYANSLLKNALDEMLLNEKDEKIIKFANKLQKFNFDNLIVTTKDIEETVELCGKILGYAINKAILGFSISEQKDFFYRF